VKSGIAKQTLALLIGWAIWALCQDLKYVPQGILWYVLQFLFPLAIGVAVGYFNEAGHFGRLVLFATLVGIGNFTYVRIANGPLNEGDAMFVLAFSFATLLPALIINQQMIIKGLRQGFATMPPGTHVAPDIARATETVKSLTNLLNAVVALIAAIFAAFGVMSKVQH
jgi:hypothetical protein